METHAEMMRNAPAAEDIFHEIRWRDYRNRLISSRTNSQPSDLN
jgi:hypothetical protein